jgi:peroxisomal 2,4-dienoyl-CoA reductase
VRNFEDCERAVATAVELFGGLDTVVNAAAGNFLAAAEELRPKGYRTVMEIDAIGTFNTSRAAFEALRASGRGVVVNISATLHYGATFWQAHASSAKAAVDSLTRSLGLEWGAYNVRVVGIAPGPIADTPGLTKLAPSDDKAAVEEALAEMVPLGRAGRTLDIALAAVFLVSDAGEGARVGDCWGGGGLVASPTR